MKYIRNHFEIQRGQVMMKNFFQPNATQECSHLEEGQEQQDEEQPQQQEENAYLKKRDG
jgi:hypothetical protein